MGTTVNAGDRMGLASWSVEQERNEKKLMMGGTAESWAPYRSANHARASRVYGQVCFFGKGVTTWNTSREFTCDDCSRHIR